MTQRKRFKSQSLPSTLEGMPDRLSHIKVQHICHCYLLCGSNEKLYFNKFESNWHFITKSDMIFLPCHPQEGWASSWGRGVRHLIFNLVAGKFLGEGSRSLYFYLVTIQQRGLDQFLREGSGSPYFYLVAITQRGLGQFLGEGSRSPHF